MTHLLQLRMTCKFMNDLVFEVMNKRRGQGLVSRLIPEVITNVLESERFFRDFITPCGKQFLNFILCHRTQCTSVGRANVHNYRSSHGLNGEVVPELIYVQQNPTASTTDYVDYAMAQSLVIDDQRQRAKLEVKALKALLKFATEKYLKRDINFVEQVADKKKFNVVFRDVRFMRRINSIIVWHRQDIENGTSSSDLRPDYTPIGNISFG